MDQFIIFFIATSIWCFSNAESQVINGVDARQGADSMSCYLPEPLVHGSYRTHPRRCPTNDSAACRLVPGTEVPDRWLLFYNCDSNYILSKDARASICTRGQWIPEFPSCIPALNIVSREDWGAQQAEEFPRYDRPANRVIIAHTATGSCDSTPDCMLTMQSIQQYHIHRVGDIGYNFVVGGEGSVFEGQGWRHIGAHTYNYNTGSICVALIGNFVSTPAPEAMLEVTRKLIEQGVATGKIARDYKLYAHCQLLQIASPGKTVFDKIKLWPNWNSMNALRCTE